MDGSDVFTELLQINPKVPVVLSSGFAEQERLRGMLAKGLRGFIPKPYTQQKLLTQIRSTLDTLQAEKTGERRVL
jgi:FixJ family two-component response regulator